MNTISKLVLLSPLALLGCEPEDRNPGIVERPVQVDEDDQTWGERLGPEPRSRRTGESYGAPFGPTPTERGQVVPDLDQTGTLPDDQTGSLGEGQTGTLPDEQTGGDLAAEGAERQRAPDALEASGGPERVEPTGRQETAAGPSPDEERRQQEPSQRGLFQGTVERLDPGEGEVVLRSGEDRITLRARPADLAALEEGQDTTVGWTVHGDALWLEPQGVQPPDTLASEPEPVRGTVSSIDRQEGTVHIAGEDYRAHPRLLEQIRPGERVDLQYVEVEGNRWLTEEAGGARLGGTTPG